MGGLEGYVCIFDWGLVFIFRVIRNLGRTVLRVY